MGCLGVLHFNMSRLAHDPYAEMVSVGGRSLLDIVDTCLDEDLVTFKATVQDLVDELEEMRGQYRLTAHKALVTRLLFIITRCSRLVLTGMPWGASI